MLGEYGRVNDRFRAAFITVTVSVQVPSCELCCERWVVRCVDDHGFEL